jgi:hypothetical protein
MRGARRSSSLFNRSLVSLRDANRYGLKAAKSMSALASVA